MNKPYSRDFLQQWSRLNIDLEKHAARRDWGLFRNTKLEMAVLLDSSDQVHASLSYYLEVCYLDINGPNNMAGESDPEILREFPDWTPDGEEIAPGVIDRTRGVIETLQIAEETVENVFLDVAKQITKSLRLPLSPGKAWPLVRHSLYEDA